jgi:PKD domain
MKMIYRKAIPLCLLIIVVSVIVGTAAADSQPTANNQKPIANFIISSGQNPLTVQNPLSIQVTDKSSNVLLVYFDFGDGSFYGMSPAGTSITHTYAKPGCYKIEELVLYEVNGEMDSSWCSQKVSVGIPLDATIIAEPAGTLIPDAPTAVPAAA